MPLLEVKNLKMEFDLEASGKFQLFKDISFKIDENESFLSILAPFRTGKSTLLKIIAGLEKPSGGEVYLNGEIYGNPDGRIIYIPEKSSSLPWLNVAENISSCIHHTSFGLSQNNAKVEEIIGSIGLNGYENHYPDNESTGFRFRISIGRALALNPALILIDDTIKGCDNLTKKELFDMLKDIAVRTGIKFIFSTADVSAAARLSDRIVIMKGHPAEIVKEFRLKETGGINLNLISAIGDIFQKDKSDDSINFII